MADYAYCHNDPINNVDVLGLARVATDGKGNLNSYGLVLAEIAKTDPAAAANLLYATQLNIELMDQGIDLTSRKRPSGMFIHGYLSSKIKGADVAAREGTDIEWSAIRRGAGNLRLPTYPSDKFLESKHTVRTRLFGEYLSMMDASDKAKAKREAILSEYYAQETKKRNSPSYRINEIWTETLNLPGRFLAWGWTTVSFADVTTGQEIVFNGWGNGGFGLEEASSTQRGVSALGLVPALRIGRFGSGFSRLGNRAWVSGASGEVSDAARRLGNRYFARGQTVSSTTESGMGVVMRHNTGQLTVIGHRSDFNLLDMNEFAKYLKDWNPSSVTFCICRGADGPAAAGLSQTLGIPVIANRYNIHYTLRPLNNGLDGIEHFAAKPGGWQIFRP